MCLSTRLGVNLLRLRQTLVSIVVSVCLFRDFYLCCMVNMTIALCAVWYILGNEQHFTIANVTRAVAVLLEMSVTQATSKEHKKATLISACAFYEQAYKLFNQLVGPSHKLTHVCADNCRRLLTALGRKEDVYTIVTQPLDAHIRNFDRSLAEETLDELSAINLDFESIVRAHEPVISAYNNHKTLTATKTSNIMKALSVEESVSADFSKAMFGEKRGRGNSNAGNGNNQQAQRIQTVQTYDFPIVEESKTQAAKSKKANNFSSRLNTDSLSTRATSESTGPSNRFRGEPVAADSCGCGCVIA
jgi:hypothetical protein